MMIFWRILHRSVILLIVFKLSTAIDLNEEAMKTIQVFCGNEMAVQTLEKCGKEFTITTDTNYGTVIKKCSMEPSDSTIANAMQYACGNQVEVGQCVVAGVPHETDDCINVHITKEQVGEFNKAIKQAQEGQ